MTHLRLRHCSLKFQGRRSATNARLVRYVKRNSHNTYFSLMSKKIFVLIALMLGAVCAYAALPFDKYTISRKELPDAARSMLDEHFPKSKVSMIKVDRHLLKKTDYDVKLTDGTKIEFSHKGEWTHIDCKKKCVPESLIPKAIRNGVAKKYDDAKIVRISRSALYYTVGLSNGRTLKYDRLGIFQGELTPKEAEEFEAEALTEADSSDIAQE